MTMHFHDKDRLDTDRLEKDQPPVDLMAAAEGLYRDSAEELIRAVNRIKTGDYDKVKDAAQSIRDLKTAFFLAIDERNRVEKLRKQIVGAVGAGELDLDAARGEIGRRLALLRSAGAGG
jgi:hypothetical protein